jgi:uncharacterized protein (TIGR00251 family)
VSWIKDHPKGSVLFIHVQPGASETKVVGLHGERLKVKLKGEPREGEANRCLIEFFSELLSLPKSKIELLSGESSRQKTVFVEREREVITSLLKLL